MTIPVVCRNCGAPVEAHGRTCAICGAAIAEEHVDTAYAGHTTTTTTTSQTAKLATPAGAEVFTRTCTTCGAPVRSVDVATCPQCGAEMPTMAASAAAQAGGPLRSPEAIANWRRSVDQLDVSAELRAAMLQAEPMLIAGCPGCGKALAVREFRTAAGRRNLTFRFGRRTKHRSPNVRPTGGPSTFALTCLSCGYTEPISS